MHKKRGLKIYIAVKYSHITAQKGREELMGILNEQQKQKIVIAFFVFKYAAMLAQYQVQKNKRLHAIVFPYKCKMKTIQMRMNSFLLFTFCGRKIRMVFLYAVFCENNCTINGACREFDCSFMLCSTSE